MQQEPLQNKDYDLISVIYHASQGYETCERYAQDAEQAGDQDVARYFHEVCDQNMKLVAKGKELLKQRLS